VAAANPLAADPSLGLQSLQSRTHLAMTGAIRIRTSGAEPRATTSTGSRSVSTPTQSPSAMPNAASDGDPPERAPAPSANSPVDARAGGSKAPNSPGIMVAGAGADPGSSAPAPIPLGRLADFVAEQAGSLTVQNPSTTNSPSSSATAPQAVKELEISLDPANLGAVSVKMRLANGKLSVVIGASSSTTLAAIENERDAISARLGSTQQPLESLVIRFQEVPNEASQDFAQTSSGGNDASDQTNSGQAGSNRDSSGAQRGGGFARGRSDPSPGGGSAGSGAGGGTGALLV
jgi:flagellar hook-length control protein FliK